MFYTNNVTDIALQNSWFYYLRQVCLKNNQFQTEIDIVQFKF